MKISAFAVVTTFGARPRLQNIFTQNIYLQNHYHPKISREVGEIGVLRPIFILFCFLIFFTLRVAGACSTQMDANFIQRRYCFMVLLP